MSLQKSFIKATSYNNALVHLISKYEEKEKTRDYYKKVVFLGTKCIVTMPKSENMTYDELREVYAFICFIRKHMAKLTYKEFQNIFPIQKVYDGDKWECKDYFYTKNYLKQFTEDDIIGQENIDELMWEYVNLDIRMFNMALFMSVDGLRKFEGKKSIMEEWADKNNITTYSIIEGVGGKKYLYNKKTGKTLKIKKQLPKYIRIIK